MLARMNVLENRAEHTWTSDQVMLLDEIVSQAMHWKTREEVSSVKQRHNFQRHQGQSHEHLQEYQQSVQRHMSEVLQEVQVQQAASGEEVEHFET